MATWLTWHGIPRPIRIGLWSLAGLLGLAVLAVGIFLGTFDPNSLKPRIVEAMKQATGREIALNGRIGLGLSLQPTLVVRDVDLDNPPGYSRPRMATLERLDLKLALVPLLSHRIEIRQLILMRPDILLETDKQGRANWEITPAKTGQGQAGATPGPQETSPTEISIVDASIENGTLAYRDGVTGSSTVLEVKTFKVTATTRDSNIHFVTEATFNGGEVALDGEAGPLTRLQDPADATPWPVRLTLASAGAKLIVDGAMTHPLEGSGYHFRITGSIPDLATLSPLTHKTLPSLKSIGFESDLHDTPGGSTRGVVLSGLKLSLPQADFAGGMTISAGSPPSLLGKLTSNKIDADALFAAFNKPAPGGAGGAPSTLAITPAQSDRLIPDTPIPFDFLRLANADLTFSGNELKFGGALYRSITNHIVLRDGKMRSDPFTADLPAGRVSGSLAVDATRAPATVALSLHAPGLAAGPLLAEIGVPGAANGDLEVRASLEGTGGTPHGIAASLSGWLGVAMANGTVDSRLLSSTLGVILRAANLLDVVERAGAGQVQCVATRLDLDRGIGTLRTMLLSSSLLTIDGDGTVNLGAETLDLRVRPRAQVVTTNVVVPLRVTGGWRSPSVTPDPAATVTENVGPVTGAVIGSTTPLGLALGALGGDKVIRQLLGGGVDCGASLAIARGQSGQVAPGRQSAPSSQPEPKPKPVSPGDVLRRLFQ